MEEELKIIRAELKSKIGESVNLDEEENDADWGCETGILLTRKHASLIIENINRTLDVKEDNELLNYSLLLNWMRQWTNLHEKKKEQDFMRILQKFIFEYMTDKYR